MSLKEFQRQADFAIVSNAGVKCALRRFGEEATKCDETIDVHFEECTLYKAKVYQQIKQQYFVGVREMDDRDIDKAE